MSESTASPTSSTSTTAAATRDIISRSSLTLLEHININIPSHEHLDFYTHVLGFGLDPRKAENILPDAAKKTLWVNCGVSQIHLPYGATPQVIPGHVGVVYDDLDGLRDRLEQSPEAYQTAHDMTDVRTGAAVIQLTDQYGNQFHCRAQPSLVLTDPVRQFRPQHILGDQDNKDESVWPFEMLERFGKPQSGCRGISHVEFYCPPKSAYAIADFYRNVLGATTSVISDNETKVAVIAIGQIDETGRSDQALVFRETSEPLPPYDGHHIALYIGESQEGFVEAFENCETAGIVWVNPRFSDKADTLEAALEYQQFRFKDIVDLMTGRVIMELEHEMRCIQHKCWTGAVPTTADASATDSAQ